MDAVRFIMKDTLEAALPECMDAVLKRKRLEQVEFSCVEGHVRLFTDRILYVESRKHKCVFCYQGAEPAAYQVYLKLDEIEGRLKEYGFLRLRFQTVKEEYAVYKGAL